MQPPPSAAQLLAVVAEVLDGEVVPALRGTAQHHARVAASLVAIVERELRLGPASADVERESLADLCTELGIEAAGRTLGDLRADLATALRAGGADDPALDRRVWEALIAAVKGDLAIAKPGHDDWAGPE